jgi:hypothetical protein
MSQEGGNAMYTWLRQRGFWVYAKHNNATNNTSTTKLMPNNNNNYNNSNKHMASSNTTKKRSRSNPVNSADDLKDVNDVNDLNDLNHSTDLTHLFLDGGKARVPREHLPAFWEAYTTYNVLASSSTTTSGQEPCLQHAVEKVGPTFKMFMDLDIPATVYSHFGDDAQAIARALLEEVPDRAAVGSVILLERIGAPKKVLTPKGSTPKVGVHLVWTSLVVDEANARSIRGDVIDRLSARDPSSAWDAVIDASVYRSGLRMSLSCKGKGTTEASAYMPSLEYEFATKVYRVIDVQEAVLASTTARCSIHVDPRRGLGLPPTAEWVMLTQEEDTQVIAQEKDDDGEMTKKLQRKRVDKADKDRFIQALPEPYRSSSCKVTSVNHHGHCVTVFVDSRYCNNIQGEHRSNKVYFVASARGIVQKCMCRCDTLEGRTSGEACSEFSLLLSDADPFGLRNSDAYAYANADTDKNKGANNNNKKKRKKCPAAVGGVYSSMLFWAAKLQK